MQFGPSEPHTIDPDPATLVVSINSISEYSGRKTVDWHPANACIAARHQRESIDRYAALRAGSTAFCFFLFNPFPALTRQIYAGTPSRLRIPST